MLIPLEKEKIVLYSEIAGAIVDLGINVILIPSMGAAGAAIGTLVAEMIVFIVQYIALRDMLLEAYRQVKYGVLLVAVLLAGTLSELVKLLSLGVFFTLCLSAVIFFVVYGIVLMLLKEPLMLEMENQVKETIKKMRKTPS